MAKGNKPRSITGHPPDESIVNRSESGLSRWSRRKAMAKVENNTTLPTHLQEEDTARAAAADSSVSIKTDADMPAIDSLKEDSDYAAFLSPKVSEKLRRLAMRKLFHLPQFNFRDGLDDYADDYTFFVPLGDTITADMRHHIQRELEAKKEGSVKKPDDERISEISAENETDKTQSEANVSSSTSGDENPGEPEGSVPDAHTTKNKITKKGKG